MNDEYDLIARFNHFRNELPGVPPEVIATLIVADVTKLCHEELSTISMVLFDHFVGDAGDADDQASFNS